MPTSKQLTMVARILIAALFLVAGVRKALGYAGTVAYFTKLGFPLPELVVPLTILLEIGGAIALIVGWRLHWVAPILALFSLGAGWMGHPFWAAEAAQFGNQLNHFLKNVALAGAFLFLAVDARERLGAEPKRG